MSKVLEFCLLACLLIFCIAELAAHIPVGASELGFVCLMFYVSLR